MAVTTSALKPAAGPETISDDPLNEPTTTAPTMPEMMPEKSGAPDARAMPRQSGTATRKITIDAGMSARHDAASDGMTRCAGALRRRCWSVSEALEYDFGPVHC